MPSTVSSISNYQLTHNLYDNVTIGMGQAESFPSPLLSALYSIIDVLIRFFVFPMRLTGKIASS